MEITKEQKGALKDMINSYAWKTLAAQIKEDVDALKEQFMNCRSMEDVHTVRGKIMMCNYVMMLPERMIASVEDDKPVDKQEEVEPVVMDDASMLEAFDN